MSINRRLGKEDVIHIHNAILLGHKKKEVLPFATTLVDLEGIMLSEINQMAKYHMISPMCRI